VTLSATGASSGFYTWLADVDPQGNVPFPWNQGTAGTTFFTVTAGGVQVKFEITYP